MDFLLRIGAFSNPKCPTPPSLLPSLPEIITNTPSKGGFR
jgi:hypothetical protein|tara:strand:- start:304 stop:423 length:120 start_codon:yes stop_codon:yes gene_type:complete